MSVVDACVSFSDGHSNLPFNKDGYDECIHSSNFHQMLNYRKFVFTSLCSLKNLKSLGNRNISNFCFYFHFNLSCCFYIFIRYNCQRYEKQLKSNFQQSKIGCLFLFLFFWRWIHLIICLRTWKIELVI